MSHIKNDLAALEDKIAEKRIRNIETLAPYCAWDLFEFQCNSAQLNARERYLKLLDQQSMFEVQRGY